jgi:hypothetical protein
MLFKFAWTHAPQARNETITKFMATGGMPLSRYHNVDGSGGFAICDTNDASALASWALDWNGLIEIKVTAIMDDEAISGVLGPRAEAGDFK